MTTEERRLSEWLREQTPEPPHTLDLAVVAVLARQGGEPSAPARRTRPPRHWVAVLAAAAVVAFVATLVGVLQGRDQDPSPATPPPTPIMSRSRSTPAPTPGSTGLTFRPWHAKLILSEQNSTLNLTAIGSFLYRVGDDLERVDPRTGRIDARRSAPSNIRTPVVSSAGRLWVVSQPGTTSVLLTAYDPLTLNQLAQFRYPVVGHDNNGPALASTGTSTIYLGAGSRVYVVDAFTGRRTQSFRVTDGMSSVAVSPDGAKLLVATGPQGTQFVEQLDARTGAVTTRGPILNSGCSGLQATRGGYFVFCEAGMQGTLRFQPADGGQPTLITSGGGGIPAEAQTSGGVVWIGGPEEAACVDPSSGRIRAHVTLGHGSQGAALTGLSVIRGRLYAAYQGTNYTEGAGIVELTPPKACGLK